MRSFLEIHSNLGALRSGVFPWNEEIGAEFAQRTKYLTVDTVFDLCAGSGHLGMTVGEIGGAKRVYLVEVDPASCLMAKSIWRNNNERKVYVIQKDIRSLPPFPLYNGLIVSNPPCAALPDSFRTWRNVYGGRDGLLYVRVIFKWLMQCQNSSLFFVSAYFLSEMKEISIEGLSSTIGADGIIKNIYYFRKPAWNWIGVGDTKNPGFSEEVFSWHLNYCENNEKASFLSFLRKKPYTHHILIEGHTF